MSIRLIDIKQTTQIVVLDWGVGLPFLFYQRNYWFSGRGTVLTDQIVSIDPNGTVRMPPALRNRYVISLMLVADGIAISRSTILLSV